MKESLPRLCEALTVNTMKDDILENSNKFCIGGKPGHKPQEHLVSLKCMIGVFMSHGLGVILQTCGH